MDRATTTDFQQRKPQIEWIAVHQLLVPAEHLGQMKAHPCSTVQKILYSPSEHFLVARLHRTRKINAK